MPMIVATSEAPSASIEFPLRVRHSPDFSTSTPDESPNEPPPLNGIHHVYDFHPEVPRQITLSNDNYNSFANLHNQSQEFIVRGRCYFECDVTGSLS